MTRGVPEMDESKSYVQWPTDWENTGEGGLAVFLIVPEQKWTECSVNLPTIRAEDVLVGGEEVETQYFPGSVRYQRRTLGDECDLTSVDLAACVCLGTTGGSYFQEEVGYFQATLGDLTYHGKQVYHLLADLYGVEPVLLTFLDT